MDSKDESPISETTETEQIRTEQREAPTSSNVLPSQDETEKEKNQSQISGEKTVPHKNSSVSIAKSSNTTDSKMKSKAVPSADLLSSTAVAKEKEVLCQGGNAVASSESLTPHIRSENSLEGTKEENKASKSVVSSQSSTTSTTAEKSTVEATEQGTVIVPSFLTAVAAEKKEKDVKPVADSASNSSGVEIKVEDSLSVASSQKNILSCCSQETEASTSTKSEVLSLKNLPSQKKIREVYRFDSRSKDDINVNDFQETIPVTATSGLSAISTDSADTTQCENRETENEGTDILDTREQEAEEVCEDNERRAYFYISSCSVPGMGEGSEWPSVSDVYRMPTVRPGRRTAPQKCREPRRCLGTQRCHYVIAAIAFLTAFIGCIAYHLSNSGIVPDVLKPIGASTAFLSFAVCVFSAVYINYLGNYTGLPSVPNYELLGDVESVMAMNRASDPEFYYATDGTYVSRYRACVSEYDFRETQSADVLDRRGYGRNLTEGLQSDSKRCSDESGTPYSTQPPKKFKAMQSPSGQDVEENNGGQAPSSSHTCEGIPPDSQNSDEDHDSDTHQLLPKKDD